jgi:hypothetical protein
LGSLCNLVDLFAREGASRLVQKTQKSVGLGSGSRENALVEYGEIPGSGMLRMALSPPPWTEIMARQTPRPSPIPWLFVVKKWTSPVEFVTALQRHFSLVYFGHSRAGDRFWQRNSCNRPT